MVKHLGILLILSFAFIACRKSEEPASPVAPPSAAPPPEVASRPADDPTTPEILLRPQKVQVAHVKQILVTYDRLNPRFPVPVRNIAEAAALVRELRAQLEKGVLFDDLMKKHSDDPETGPDADSLFMESDGTPGSTRQLALRLEIGEVGVVQTGNAFHVMTRVAEPAAVRSPDSTEILAREPLTQSAGFKSINLAWRGLKQVYLTQITEGALKRTQSQAAQLARDILARITAGDSFDELITQYGEKIPMPEETHVHPIKITGMTPNLASVEGHGDHKHGPDCDHGDHAGHDHAAPMQPSADGSKPRHPFTSAGLREVPEVGRLSLRLKVGEAGIVTSRYGYHVVLRVR